jgi:hypothetical protein
LLNRPLAPGFRINRLLCRSVIDSLQRNCCLSSATPLSGPPNGPRNGSSHLEALVSPRCCTGTLKQEKQQTQVKGRDASLSEAVSQGDDEDQQGRHGRSGSHVTGCYKLLIQAPDEDPAEHRTAQCVLYGSLQSKIELPGRERIRSRPARHGFRPRFALLDHPIKQC